MQKERIWTGSWIAGNNNWINTGSENGKDKNCFTSPAPYIRKCFDLEKVPE